MSQLNCPICGSLVKAPGAKPYARLHCRKCHTPFHLSKTGVPTVGEPPDPEKEFQELKQKVHQELRRFPVGTVVKGLAVAVVLGLGWYLLFGPAERLERAAGRAAHALADGDPATLKGLAEPGTAEDVAHWYEIVRPQVVAARQQWVGKLEAVEARVGREDLTARKGAAGLFIHAAGGPRDVSLANPAEATAGAAAPFEAETEWVLSRWGRWKLDGSATYAKVRPTR